MSLSDKEPLFPREPECQDTSYVSKWQLCPFFLSYYAHLGALPPTRFRGGIQLIHLRVNRHGIICSYLLSKLRHCQVLGHPRKSRVDWAFDRSPSSCWMQWLERELGEQCWQSSVHPDKALIVSNYLTWVAISTMQTSEYAPSQGAHIRFLDPTSSHSVSLTVSRHGGWEA